MQISYKSKTYLSANFEQCQANDWKILDKIIYKNKEKRQANLGHIPDKS